MESDTRPRRPSCLHCDRARPYRILKIPVPQTAHVPFTAFRPFAISVICGAEMERVVRHFMQ